jgi:hypothetical protein
MVTVTLLPRRLILGLIRLYQKTISPDHGLLRFAFPHGFCRFHPSCSEYAYQSINVYGLIRGGLKASWRVLRCNPFNKGGNDPVQ